jgi:hypothetical protein
MDKVTMVNNFIFCFFTVRGAQFLDKVYGDASVCDKKLKQECGSILFNFHVGLLALC